MKTSITRMFAWLAFVAASTILATQSQADPLTGRDLLKFSQRPMLNTTIVDTTGTQIGVYAGHDEVSTAYGFPDATGQITQYDGPFMADDFADKLTSPVVHVKWWGSYMHDNDPLQPQPPVQKFLIAFESDVPAATPPGYSYPGAVQQLDVVTRSLSLAPGSGQFTEKLVGGPDIFGDLIYEYNAELHLNNAFFEQMDTVYWLKIAALVDLPVGTQFLPPYSTHNPPPGITQWGWHNRDYTMANPDASILVSPGEIIDGTVGTSNIYHFQDDAVSGDLRWQTTSGIPNFGVTQNNMLPANYVAGADGPFTGQIPGTIGIDNYSKDLAFELYTVQVPEPAACLLLVCGSLGLATVHRRRRG